MALALPTYTTPQGVAVPNAYAKIDFIIGNKTQMNVNVKIYATQAIADAVQPNPGQLASYLEQRTHTIQFTDGPTWTQVYTALKALPAYAGTTDC